MSEYTLVRVSRQGRQSLSEEVHCVGETDEDTLCGKFDKHDVRKIRNLGVYAGEANICGVCGEVYMDVM
jgi:hypothetical protein